VSGAVRLARGCVAGTAGAGAPPRSACGEFDPHTPPRTIGLFGCLPWRVGSPSRDRRAPALRPAFLPRARVPDGRVV